MYDFFHLSGDAVQLDGAVVDRVLQCIGDFFFLGCAVVVLLVLIIGVLCMLAFRSK